VEDDLWSVLIDSVGWFIKIFKDELKDIVKEELLPFIKVKCLNYSHR
jgi:hypothetical protein